MLHKTRGIVLRTVKYGETSVIVTMYAELFGLQSYLVNGVRTSSRKGPGKANLFQPAAILDLVVYRNELRNLQRIREFKWAHIYQYIYFDVIKNAVALFMVELLQKCLKQPESNAELYQFIEDAFIHLDAATPKIVGNFPLYFILHLAGFFGFRIQDEYRTDRNYLDLKEGTFIREKPAHPYFLEGSQSFASSQLLKIMQPEELVHLDLNQDIRRNLLQAFQQFYALHVPDFGTMKTFPVLQTILSE